MNGAVEFPAASSFSDAVLELMFLKPSSCPLCGYTPTMGLYSPGREA